MEELMKSFGVAAVVVGTVWIIGWIISRIIGDG